MKKLIIILVFLNTLLGNALQNDTQSYYTYGNAEDRDGDGVVDSQDQCIDVPGTKSNNGCPETTSCDLVYKLISYNKEIVFIDDETDLDKTNQDLLLKIVEILNSYPESRFTINANGTTTIIAKQRLKNVYHFLVKKGLKKQRLTIGYIETNKTYKHHKQYVLISLIGGKVDDKDMDGVLDEDDQCIDTPGTAANNGCPEIHEYDRDCAGLSPVASFPNFDFESTTLNEKSKGILNSNAEAILGNKTKHYTFLIEGHCDIKEKNPIKLSKKRALKIISYLISRGIDKASLKIAAKGNDYPIDTNTTESGRFNNRRVEIKAIKKL